MTGDGSSGPASVPCGVSKGPLLPYVEINSEKKGLPKALFVAGFPDNQLSGWGDALPASFAQTHHCVFVCLPGYEHSLTSTGFSAISPDWQRGSHAPEGVTMGGGEILPRWGLSFEELSERLARTILTLFTEESTPMVTLAHDWGAYLLLFFLSIRPELNSKHITFHTPAEAAQTGQVLSRLELQIAAQRRMTNLVLMDVGLLRFGYVHPFQGLVIALYQLWFAVSYMLWAGVAQWIGHLLLSLFFLTVPSWLRPTSSPTDTPRVPVAAISAEMLYPYFRLWLDIITLRPHTLTFPPLPTFFMWGENKNAMFHDDLFLEQLSCHQSCRQLSVAAGHWFVAAKPQLTLQAIRDFISGAR